MIWSLNIRRQFFWVIRSFANYSFKWFNGSWTTHTIDLIVILWFDLDGLIIREEIIQNIRSNANDSFERINHSPTIVQMIRLFANDSFRNASRSQTISNFKITHFSIFQIKFAKKSINELQKLKIEICGCIKILFLFAQLPSRIRCFSNQLFHSRRCITPSKKSYYIA